MCSPQGAAERGPKVSGGTGKTIIRAARVSCVLAMVTCSAEHLSNISLIPYNHPELDS